MTTFTSPTLNATTAIARPLLFDRAMVVLCGIFVGGLYLDGWAHQHGMVDESFFTPWHAFFYGGYALVAALLAGAGVRGVLQGRSWLRALPAGYHSALVGAPLFALGGVGDLAWHTVFGIEDGIEALYSPSHLVLAVSMGLMITAPIGAALRRGTQAGVGPALGALALLVALIAFMSQSLHPLVYVLAANRQDELGQALGLGAIIVQSALFVGAVSWARTHLAAKSGAIVLIVGLPLALASVLDDRYALALAMVIGALLLELVALFVRRSGLQRWELPLVGALLPMAIFGGYFLALQTFARIAWSVHLWSGAIVVAGIVGLLIALIVRPIADLTRD